MITVYKNDHNSKLIWSYQGRIIERGETWVCLEAIFGRDDVQTAYVTFRRGDRMIEWFYSDRWYNIFEIHDVDDDRIKGWYCNLTRPAQINADSITADDMALDVFITTNGEVILDDEDEYAALDLSAEDRAGVETGVETLRRLVAERVAPFDRIIRR